jgi:1,4-dihydroxy-2-naphthoyl-CoA hydrolase
VKPYSYEFTVAFHEVDAAGIMFFAHLFGRAHDAYESFMSLIGFPLEQILREGIHLLPLARAEADYHVPVRHGERLDIWLCVSAIGRSSFTLHYRFADKKGRARADARTVHVNMVAGAAASAPLPEALRRALEPWLCPRRWTPED